MFVGRNPSHFSPGFGFGVGFNHPSGGAGPQRAQQGPGHGQGFGFGHFAKDSFQPAQAQGGKPPCPTCTPQKPAGAPGAPGAPGQAGQPAQPGQAGGAQGDGVPYISQYTPVGADGAYKNGEENCGPAVMAMIAREHGMGKGVDDADLISQLGKVGQTDATGTSGNGLVAMADQLGLKSDAKQGADSNWVVSQLQQGKDVIANGDFFALPQHGDANQTSPHFILLTGVDASGNITVKDPADPAVKTITKDQLDAFNRAHPDGGYNISIG